MNLAYWSVPVAVAVATALLHGCASSRPQVDPAKMPVCQECFDAVSAARTSQPATGPTHNELIRTYDCPCCKTEMSVYIENGTHMVRCEGCVADGVAWDRCRPSAEMRKN